MANLKSILPTGAIRWILGASVILAFLVGLFFAGIAVYGAVIGVPFADAWANFLAVCRK